MDLIDSIRNLMELPVRGRDAPYTVVFPTLGATGADPDWPYPLFGGMKWSMDRALAAFHAGTLRRGLVEWPKREAVAALATLDASRISPVELAA